MWRGSQCGRAVGAFCHSGTPCRDFDVDAAFMLLEHNAACLSGPLQDVLKPDIQCVRTHWKPCLMAFHLAAEQRSLVTSVR